MINQVQPPIFHIIGAWRSGTTLLSAMLDSHPEIMAPLESTFVMKAYSRFGDQREWTEEDIEELLRLFYRNRDLKYVWKPDEQQLKRDMLHYALQHANTTFGDHCKIVYLHYPSVNTKNGIKAIVDKNPAYTLVLKELLKIYPETKFIALIRDYRDNILSRRKYNFHKVRSTAVYAQWWNKINEAVRELQEEFPEKVLLIRYEDLAAEPEKYMQQVCRFINIPFRKEMLEFNKEFTAHTEKYIQDLQVGLQDDREEFREERLEMGANLFQPVNTSKINNWKDNMSLADVRTAEYICGELGEKYGYERSLNSNVSRSLKVKKLLAQIYVYFSAKIYLRKIKS